MAPMAQAFTQYLKRRGNRWFLKLPIPRAIRHLYRSESGRPREHIEEALGTGDLNTANRMKHARIAYWTADFTAKERAAAGTLSYDLAKAEQMREALRAALTPKDIETTRDYIADRADDIATQSGSIERASEFMRLATAKLTMREAWARWAEVNEHDKATRLKDEQALRSLMDFLGVADLAPSAITPDKARAYVRWLNTEARSARGGPLSKPTKDARLWPLRAFWQYMEQQEVVPSNPWRGHKITGRRKPGEEQPDKKRSYSNDEIISLIKGPELRASKGTRYPKRTLLEVYALCFYTGARIGEIANRSLGDLEKIKGGYRLHIRTGKTDESPRSIPIYHPIPVAVIRRRIGKRTDPLAQLFEEFIPGGPNSSLAWYLSKALGHYRDRVGLGAATDTHSTRRRFITDLRKRGVDRMHVQHYVGHRPEGTTDGIYAGPTDEAMRKVARAIRYPASIEQAFQRALQI